MFSGSLRANRYERLFFDLGLSMKFGMIMGEEICRLAFRLLFNLICDSGVSASVSLLRLSVFNYIRDFFLYLIKKNNNF